MALVIDTGPLYATLDVDDMHHYACAELVVRARERLVLPAPILPEVDYLCHERLGGDAFLSVLAEIERGAYEVEELRPPDYRRVAEICDEYRDLKIGFVDAAVLAIVERLRETKLATLDRRHFGVVRPAHIDALVLLPTP